MEVERDLPEQGDDAALHESMPESAEGGGESPRFLPSDSDSDSDSGSDDEAAADLEIETLERALSEQPLDYDSHVKYIQCLRRSGKIEKLRAAREAMSNYFPLSPKLWLEWVKDEVSLATSEESITWIEQLYVRGVQDYLSVELWCDYLSHIQKHDPSVSQCSHAGVSKMRDLFERALTATGLHAVEGSKIWKEYREFEQAVHLTISDDNEEEKLKQAQRVRALFHRQLSIPSADLRSTLLEYKEWESEQGNANDPNSDLDGLPANIASAFKKATESFNARKQYEDELMKEDASEAEKFQTYLSYIKYEESCGDPARVQILYERAVTEFPVSADLWIGYTSYIDKTLKVSSVLKNVYFRATRNCSWVSDIWVRYLLSLERVHASEEELRSAFDRSLNCTFPSINEYLNIYLTRVDGLRRRMSSASGEDSGLDIFQLIRQTFTAASDLLSAQLEVNDLLHLHAYWARLEAKFGKDSVAARGVWEGLLKKSGALLEVWQQYIAMEIGLDHVAEARSIYKRCYTKKFPGTGSEEICNSWLQFEREYGSIDEFDLAMKKITPRLKELEMFKAQQEPKADDAQSTKKDTVVSSGSAQKRKGSQLAAERKHPAKKKKDYKQRNAHAPKKMPVDVSESTEVIEAVIKDVEMENADLSSEYKSSKKLNKTSYDDQCTAFISNLDTNVTEVHIRRFFTDIGGVTAIRLPKDKFTGRPRGLAYVDFQDDEHLQAAIAKNKQKLLGKKIGIFRSDPKNHKGKDQASGKFTRDHVEGPSKGDHGREEQVVDKDVKPRYQKGVQLIGKNTFAAPRSVAKPLGWTAMNQKSDRDLEELKSNDEFRNLLLKKLE